MEDAQSILSKANKTASSASSGFSFFGAKTDKLEQAAELYTQAANAFRISNQGQEAGITFEKAAAIQKRLDEHDDAALSLTEAFKVYKRTSPEDAARCLEQVINHYAIKGNLRRAATHKQSLGELYEIDIKDNVRAIKAYKDAGDWFQSDNAEALASKMYLKVAELSALQGDYVTATQKYEEAAIIALHNNSMRPLIKGHWLKAGICHLATGDAVATQKAINSYCDLYRTLHADKANGKPALLEEREIELLQNITDAASKKNLELFGGLLYNYDQMTRLDQWMTTMLTRVRVLTQKAIDEDDDLT